ncbi:hypothetical protein MMC14_005694 [Varicellaria rhodocarpa]|nr:hypothetical protein [Varicellaria rhodocarpa]
MNSNPEQRVEPNSLLLGQARSQISYPLSGHQDLFEFPYLESATRFGTYSSSSMPFVSPSAEQVESSLLVSRDLEHFITPQTSFSSSQGGTNQNTSYPFEPVTVYPFMPEGQHLIANPCPSLRRRYPQEKWDAVQPIIQLLYIDQGLPLSETKKIMEQKHGFIASTKQYKDKIKLWGFQKNVTKREVGTT